MCIDSKTSRKEKYLKTGIEREKREMSEEEPLLLLPLHFLDLVMHSSKERTILRRKSCPGSKTPSFFILSLSLSLSLYQEIK
jgi:hypothetical protein